MQFPATLVQLAEKPPASPQQPVARQWNLFRLNLFISCNFRQLWLSWQKNPHSQQPDNENFLGWIHPFHAISSNFGSAGRKAPAPQVACGQTVKFFQTIFISCNFQQIWFSWQKSPLTHLVAKQWKFLDWIYPFHAISSNFGSAGRKACPLPSSGTVKFFRLDLSISCNFQQLWFSWQKSPLLPPAASGQTVKFF